MAENLPKTAYKTLPQLRGLDLDDLYFMSYFYYGFTMAEIAKMIGVTAPAIRARTLKIKEQTGILIYVNENNTIMPTSEGLDLCKLASEIIYTFEKYFKENLKAKLIEVCKADISNQAKPNDPTRNNGYLGCNV